VQAFKKFNTTLDKNAKLREKIDKLVNERHIFGKIYTRIEEEVVLYQEETEQVRLETEQREEMCKEVRKKIEELIKQDREESSQFEATVGSKQGEIKVRGVSRATRLELACAFCAVPLKRRPCRNAPGVCKRKA